MFRRTSLDLSVSQPAPVAPLPQADEKKKNNRLSLSALASSIWGPRSPPPQQPSNLKPMLLASSLPVSGQPPSFYEEEDEEDAITRARLKAEMQLLGFQQSGSPSLHSAAQMRATSPDPIPEEEVVVVDRSSRRTSLASHRRSMSINTSPNPSSLAYIPSNTSPPRLNDFNLSAASKMDAAAARDKDALDKLNQGQASGFTEMARRPSTRRRDSSLTSTSSGIRYSVDNNIERPMQTPPPQAEGGWSSKLLRRVSLNASPKLT